MVINWISLFWGFWVYLFWMRCCFNCLQARLFHQWFMDWNSSFLYWEKGLEDCFNFLDSQLFCQSNDWLHTLNIGPLSWAFGSLICTHYSVSDLPNLYLLVLICISIVLKPIYFWIVFVFLVLPSAWNPQWCEASKVSWLPSLRGKPQCLR